MTDKFEEKLFLMAEEERMCLPKSLEIKIDEKLKNLQKPRGKSPRHLRRWMPLAAALAMLFSITAAAATGMVRQRMEAMNREKLEDYFVQVYTSKVPADNYNRPYKEEERSRMEELQRAYQEEARFPEGEITMMESAGSYKGKGVAFLKDTSTFFFPEKEMSDEELLQIIDFYYKRDYSLQKMTEMAAQGETEIPQVEWTPGEPAGEGFLQSGAALSPGQELTVPYKGDLSLLYMAAGNNCIFLTGWNAIHKMEFGSNESVMFFNDFGRQTRITALCQDARGDIYLGLMQYGEDGWESALWVLSGEGEFLREIDLSAFRQRNITFGGISSDGFIRQLAADREGNLYLKGAGYTDEDFLLVIDTQGGLVARVPFGDYTSSMLGGIGIGKDGKAYTMVQDGEKRMGIASINPKEGCLEEIYMGIVPDTTLCLDLIAPGYDADFVFWGYDGIFSYNKGEDRAFVAMPAYETPCHVEGALACVLPDGRIVLASCTEYTDRETEEGIILHERIPEKTCFYYLPSLRETR